ncbi:MAG TPA: hormogonium polysaccharide biosynthesis glycosyltransferase HpsE [Coleofasciculaceae cyanobacterium]|jgi:glycosyltransferase involved in cell wall biosynthesis
MDITVAIPTYNGESRLPNVLERLRSQINTEHLAWEILVVDNNSTDNTAKIVQDYQANWSAPYALNYCFEAEQGLAFARQRAVKEASGTLIAFLDDDNLPANDWVATAYSFGRQHPRAGAFSGQIHGDFEVTPPENFKRIQAFLAIREHGCEPHRFEPENLRLPPGAGLVVRQQAWYESVPNRPILIGRVGGTVVAGEDYEVLLHLHKAGWEIWYNPEMHMAHQIPHWRLERDYLLPLSRGIGLATCQLRMINAKNWQKPIVFVRTLLGNLRRVVLHSITYRGQLKNDLIAACELEFFWGSLMSPFYLLRKFL